MAVQLERILQEAVERGISDVLLKDGNPPLFRFRGEFLPMDDAEPLTPQELQAALTRFLVDDAQRMRFLTERCADLAFGEPDLGRFRINAYRQRGKVAIAVRVIPAAIPEFRDLNLPPIVERLANERRGMILVTGPTGSGKTTTLAAIIGHINRQSARHIITIEDPIEYVHQDERAVICQREIGADVDSFAAALRVALRQIPDVIMLGEMRDPETIATALAAAETGHLVLATLHSPNAAQTLERITGIYEGSTQRQVIIQLANVLQGILAQDLLPSADRTRRVLAYELLVATPAVRNLIRENKVAQLENTMQVSAKDGMVLMDNCLADLYERCLITYDTALSRARRAENIAKGSKTPNGQPLRG